MSRRRNWGDDSSKRVELAGGGSVELTFKGNLFDLDDAERKLLADLTQVIQTYRNGEVAKAKAAAPIFP